MIQLEDSNEEISQVMISAEAIKDENAFDNINAEVHMDDAEKDSQT